MRELVVGTGGRGAAATRVLEQQQLWFIQTQCSISLLFPRLSARYDLGLQRLDASYREALEGLLARVSETLYACLCVCVWQGERDRDRQTDTQRQRHTDTSMWLPWNLVDNSKGHLPRHAAGGPTLRPPLRLFAVRQRASRLPSCLCSGVVEVDMCHNGVWATVCTSLMKARGGGREVERSRERDAHTHASTHMFTHIFTHSHTFTHSHVSV